MGMHYRATVLNFVRGERRAYYLELKLEMVQQMPFRPASAEIFGLLFGPRLYEDIIQPVRIPSFLTRR